MRVLLACLLLAACTSAPARPRSDGGETPDAPDSVVPYLDGGATPDFNDPLPGMPVARLMGAPLDIDFGTVNTGSAPRANPVVITNIGDAQSAALQANLTSAAELKLTTNCVGRQLMPGETCVVTATFEPKSVGPQLASGSVTDGSGTSFGVVTFTAHGAGRLGPDAGPDAPPPPKLDAGPDVMAAPDAGRDLAPSPPDLPHDVAPEAAPRLDAAPMPDLAPGN
jgi:hypothetical protein